MSALGDLAEQRGSAIASELLQRLLGLSSHGERLSALCQALLETSEDAYPSRALSGLACALLPLIERGLTSEAAVSDAEARRQHQHFWGELGVVGRQQMREPR